MKKIAIVILLLLTLCLCGCERNEGEIMENDPFYSLQKIYNDKLLTRDELRKINRKYYEETDFDLSEDLEVEDADLITEEDVIITITNRGYIKRMTVDTYRAQRRGGKGITGSKMQ